MLKQKSNKKFLKNEDKCALLFKSLRGKNVSNGDLRKIKLNEFFDRYHEINSYFPCVLVNGNVAWISHKDGEYRYFSQRNKEIFMLDVFDLLQIQFNQNYKELCNWFKDTLDIKIENDFFKEQTEKYLCNMNFLHSDTFQNSNARKIFKEKEDVFNELNKVGLESLFSKTLVQQKDAIFFASSSYIRERLDNKYSLTTINRIVNTFAVLGMINKIKESDIPIEFNQSKVVKFKNFTSYFSVPNLEENFGDIERKSQVFLANNLSYYSISKKKILEVFGKDIYNSVYVQDTYKGKEENVEEKTEKNDIKSIFRSILEEFEYVSKEIFIDHVANRASKSYAKTFLESEYSKLVKEYGLRVVKPNKRLKTRLGLKNGTSVAIKL